MSDTFGTRVIDDLVVMWSRIFPNKDLDTIKLKDDNEIDATGLMQNLLKEVLIPGNYGEPSHDSETFEETSIQYHILGTSEERILLNNEKSKDSRYKGLVSVFYKRAVPSLKLTYDDFVRRKYDLGAKDLSRFEGQKWARTENWTDPNAKDDNLTLGFTTAYWVAPADLPNLGLKINELHNFFGSIDK